MREFSVSQRRACRLLGMDRSSARYQSRTPRDDGEVPRVLAELARRHPRYGYRRLWSELRDAGWKVNHKRVYRLYREGRLLLRRKQGRRLKHTGTALPLLERPNQQWALDFVHDRIGEGRALRVLTVLDEFTRECLTLEVDTGISSRMVAIALERVIAERAVPTSLRLDNGPEFRSRYFAAWCRSRGIALDYITPGRPMQNGYIESFNGKLRDECLNLHCFRNLHHARECIGQWREHYNRTRPHSALGYLTPARFAQEWSAALTRTAAPGSLALAVQSASAADSDSAFFHFALNHHEGRSEKMLLKEHDSHYRW